ncbi:hypothetical protein Btru_053418 [Bulinus truncatus]|nr:hypothetical protein Btru_053418 [Bulinus truncatus]
MYCETILKKIPLKKCLVLIVYLATVEVFVYIGQTGLPPRDVLKYAHNETNYGFGEQLLYPRNAITATTTGRVMKIMDLNPRPNCLFHCTYRTCEYQKCAHTFNPSEADLLMINGARLHNVSLPKRPRGQIWLMYSREPMTDKRFILLNQAFLRGQFNWTKTYLNDSTFFSKYGRLKARDSPSDTDYEKIFNRKKYDVAWFVSHCNTSSKRELYVQRMSSQVQIHVFGRCGNYSCGRKGYTMGGSRDTCLEMLSRDYKFYLSFENSFCRDYVTEKFFNLFPDTDVIPVVRGGADYKRFFPPDIYVNSLDFASPEELGKYLHHLARDKTKYLTMLKKKDGYEKTGPASNVCCDLCKALHTRTPSNVYDNIYSWITRPGVCWPPTDI